jgi:spore germination protein YaaH
MRTTLAFAVTFALFACGCGLTPSGSIVQTDTKAIPARRGTVIADGCTLDPWQMETLQTNAAKLVIREVVLDCMLPHADGTVTPADESSRVALAALIATLHNLGYSVSLAASFVTDDGYTYDGAQTAAELSDGAWVAKVASGIAQISGTADAVDLDLELLPFSARGAVTQLVATVAASIKPARALNVFLPPSTVAPSDVRGGDAFDVPTLAKYTNRFRVMTLDFSGRVAGPTIDSGWAVDAVTFASQQSGAAALDVAFPLYGNDFTTSGSGGVRFTTYLEALGIADTYTRTPVRGATDELFIDYTDGARQTHELWYDDAQSTLVTLGAWDPKTLPASVGVVFYGFGAEDPALWSAIAGATTP